MSNKPKTQRVKVLVLVAKDGSYAAGSTGSKGKHDDDISWLYDCLPPHVRDRDCHQVWVEVDVPLPSEPPVTKGESKADRDAMESTFKFIRDECDWESDKRIGPAITRVLEGEAKP